MKSRYLAIVFIFLNMLTNIHCSRSDRAQPHDSTIIVGHYGDERIFLHDFWGMEATYLMFLPLVESMYGYIEPQPALAERWEHSGDYREWTFYLRKNVKWHDGVPVTAHDIKFTTDLRRKLGRGGGSVEILNDYAFKVSFPKPGYPSSPDYSDQQARIGQSSELSWRNPYQGHDCNDPAVFARRLPGSIAE